MKFCYFQAFFSPLFDISSFFLAHPNHVCSVILYLVLALYNLNCFLGEEEVKGESDRSLYVRRWNPTTYTLGELHEVVLHKDHSNANLKKKDCSFLAEIKCFHFYPISGLINFTIVFVL